MLEASSADDVLVISAHAGGLSVLRLDGTVVVQFTQAEDETVSAQARIRDILGAEVPGLSEFGNVTQVAVPHGVVLGTADLDRFMQLVPEHGKREKLQVYVYVDAFTGNDRAFGESGGLSLRV